MKIITIYELLGMVKDGKAPKKIKYENCEYYLYDNKSYITTDKTRMFDKIYFSDLNTEVEILEEESKVQVELTEKEYLEYLDKINENIKRVRDYIPKPSFLKLEEEKKIPEKLKIGEKSVTIKGTTFFRDKDIEIFQKLSMEINEIIDYLDYLKSKGE